MLHYLLLIVAILFAVAALPCGYYAYQAGQGTSTGDLGGFFMYVLGTIVFIVMALGFGTGAWFTR